MLTAIVRDDRYLEHMPGHTHPEHPSRLRAVHDMLDRDPPGPLLHIAPELAMLKELERVHTPAYIKTVLQTAAHPFTNLAPDTPACAKSYLSAWLAVGGCLRAVDALMEKRCAAVFCLVRPPGHHAQPDRAAGFCFFNNLGIAARYAADRYRLSRIMIVDWDIHHGNGLQELFYASAGTSYFSTHDALLFPYTGAIEEAGTGPGTGYTVNIPMPRSFGDDAVLHLYRHTLGPFMRAIRPEIVLVAAGFDAHHDDPIGRSPMTAAGFGRLARLVCELVRENGAPPLLLALEGGYHIRALAACVREVLCSLTQAENATGAPPASPLNAEASAAAEILAAKVHAVHRPHGVWMP